MSSFGGPGGKPTTRPTPPERGSFPLDHDGECTHVMTSYLECMKKGDRRHAGGCRDLSKAYLACRMDRNLMARDDFKNLGFQDLEEPQDSAKKSSTGDKEKAKAPPGELRW